MSETPELWNLTDEEIAEELSRMSWYWDSPGLPEEVRQTALLHEGLRRILLSLIAMKEAI